MMISMGISAKQEKDVKFQKLKKELSEMIAVPVPSESKVVSVAGSKYLILVNSCWTISPSYIDLNYA